MTKGALYKHYKNKQDIFDSIVARMEQRDAEQAGDYEVPEGTVDEMEEALSEHILKAAAGVQQSPVSLLDGGCVCVPVPRLLTLEQYRSETMGKLFYQQYLAAGPMGYVADLFAGMGFSEPQEKAASFYAPMFFLYTVYDGAEASEKEAVLALADACLEQSCKSLKQEKEETV